MAAAQRALVEVKAWLESFNLSGYADGLADQGYDDMLAFELDLKQLFDNARLYNAAESLVYADAVAMEKIALEKLGKTVRPRFPTRDHLPCLCARPA